MRAPGIVLGDPTATGNVVQGNYIGVNVTGTAALPNTLLQGGINVTNGASGNTIGGSVAGAGNVVSGNTQHAITVFGSTTNDNVIQGNFIGTNPTGLIRLANGGIGVDVVSAQRTIVGGPGAARNVISGNGTGMQIRTGAAGTVVQNNYIGVNAAGTAAIFNGTGITINDNAVGNTIGGATAGLGNVISGNTATGLSLASGSNGNTIQGNFIGVDAAGNADLGNTGDGINLNGVSGTIVGGTTPGARNVVSGNNNVGIRVTGRGGDRQPDPRELHRRECAGQRRGAEHAGWRHPSDQRRRQRHWRHGGRRGQRHFRQRPARHPRADSREREHHSGQPDRAQRGRQPGSCQYGARHRRERCVGNDHRRDRRRCRERDFRQRGRRHQPRRGIDRHGDSGQSHRHERQRVRVASERHQRDFHRWKWHDRRWNRCGRGKHHRQQRTVGVNVANGTGNAILGNSIFSNGNLGINLGPASVATNDAGDGDLGANNTQNYPVLAAAPGGVQGTFNSTPNGTFTIHYYGNTACDPSQNGEGETFLGSAPVNTDANGNATLPLFTAAAGLIVTATATSSTNDTSEFSACVTVPLGAGDVHGHEHRRLRPGVAPSGDHRLERPVFARYHRLQYSGRRAALDRPADAAAYHQQLGDHRRHDRAGLCRRCPVIELDGSALADAIRPAHHRQQFDGSWPGHQRIRRARRQH